MNILDTTFVLKDIISKLELNVAYINDTMYKNNNNHDSWCLGLFDDFFDKFADNPWCDIGILVAFIFILYFLVIKNGKIQKFVTNNLGIIAVIIAAMGTFLYFAGFNEKGCANNVFALLLRSVMSSLEMFVSHSDLIEVRHECHESSAYMTLFSLTHFLAVLVSAIFIIKLLGLQIISKLKLFGWRISDPISKKDFFVFWGVNHNSIRLAKSISEKNIKSRIIFINLHKEHHAHSSRFTFSHFFHSANEDVERYASDIDNMNAILLNARKSFNDINITPSKEILLFKELGVSRLCDGLIKKTLNTNKNKVEYYILSDTEKDNITTMIVLKKYFNENQSDKHKLNLDNFSCYFHVRKNNMNMALLGDGFKYNMHYIDSSSLSVLQLKKDVEYHPVKFVDVDRTTGMVSSDFTAMIVGFGETGRDAFRFLYEFCSFVCDSEGNESPKCFHIVDDNLNNIKADFLNDAPALKDKANIKWCSYNTHSNEFWNIMRNTIEKLNYIVIALDNDEEAMSVAVDISEFAYRYRKDVEDKFRIFVRIKDKKMHDSIKEIKPNSIHPFGADEDIFTYNTVSEDVVEDGAKEFYAGYMETMIKSFYKERIYSNNYVISDVRNMVDEWGKFVKGINDAVIFKTNKELSKIDLNKNKKELSKTEKDLLDSFYKKIENINFVYEKISDKKKIECLNKVLVDSKILWNNRRNGINDNKEDEIKVLYQEEQDKSNYYHALTKRELVDDYKKNEDILSHCEHLRWNAKMELMGFIRDGENKDSRRRQHKNIIDCKTLEDKYKDTIKYDKKVVELSFSDKIKFKDL